jgi:hypothetical protein
MKIWKERAKNLYHEWRSHLIVWLVSSLGGSAVLTAIWRALLEEFHRSPVDWYFVGALFVIGLGLVAVAVWMRQTSGSVVASLPVPASPELKLPPVMTIPELPLSRLAKG